MAALIPKSADEAGPAPTGILGSAASFIGSAWTTITKTAPVVWDKSKGYAWFAASTAVLLAMPLMIEMQREAMLAFEKQEEEAQRKQMEAQRQGVA